MPYFILISLLPNFAVLAGVAALFANSAFRLVMMPDRRRFIRTAEMRRPRGERP